MRRSILRRVGYPIIIVLVGVLLVEGTTRVLLSVFTTPPPEPVIPRDLEQFNELLGWSPTPMFHGVSSRTGYEIEYRINSKGLRDDESSYSKPGHVFRIVTLGDSRTFGFGVPIEKHFSRLLEGYFVDVEVINMGVNGFGVDQELLYLSSEGLRYEPDLVLAYVAHYGAHRHMHSKRFGKEKPQYKLIDGELVLENSTLSDESFLPPNSMLSSDTLRTIHRWIRDRSKAYSELTTGLRDLLRAERRPDAKQAENRDKKNSDDSAFREELYALGEALVNEMREEASRNGAEFALITHIPELHEATLARGTASLYVSAALDNEQFDLPEDFKHINEAGNGVLAWEIAQFLKANQLVPDRHIKD